MPELCPCCGRKLPAAKPVTAATDPATMTDRELYAHYKRTAPIEDLRFFLRSPTLSAEVRAEAESLLARALVKIPPTYKAEYARLKMHWRIDQMAAEDTYNRQHRIYDPAIERWIDPPIEGVAKWIATRTTARSRR